MNSEDKAFGIFLLTATIGFFAGLLAGNSSGSGITFSGNIYVEATDACSQAGGIANMTVEEGERGHWVKAQCVNSMWVEYHHHERFE